VSSTECDVSEKAVATIKEELEVGEESKEIEIDSWKVRLVYCFLYS
jgi:hypothetical protein